MRPIILFTIALFCYTVSYAQTINQKGSVQSISYVYGESGEPIEDVKITVLTEVRSDSNGTFLVPVNYSPEGVFSFKEIQKNGYTLISPKKEELSREFYAINPDADVRIVMVSKEELYKERRRIEANMQKTHEAEIDAKDREIRLLESKIDSLKTISANTEELEALIKAKQEELDAFKEEYYDSYCEIEKEAKALSEIDYSALSEVEAKIIELKKEGKGVEAAELSKSQISSKHWKKINSDPTSMKRDMEKKRRDYEAAEKKFTETRKMLYSTFEGYKIAYCHEEAAQYLKLYVDMDPKDYEGILSYAAYLIKVLQRFDEASEYLSLILEDNDAPIMATVDAKTFLGDITSLKGFRIEAIKIFDDALEIARQNNLTKSMISIQNNIARSYYLLNDYQHAVEIFRKALQLKDSSAMSEKSLANLYLGLANSLTHLSETDEAKICLDNVSNLLEPLKDADEIFLISDYYSVLAQYFNTIGNNAGRLEAHKKSIELLTEYYGGKHTNIASEYNNIASVYMDNGQYSVASEYLKKGLEMYEAQKNTHHPNYITIATKYNRLLFQQGKYEKALNGLLSIESEINNIGSQNYDGIRPYVFQLVALCYKQMHEMDKAAKYYTNYLQSTIKKYGEMHSETAWAYNALGFFYFGIGEYKKARQFFETNMEILQQLLPENHIDFTTTFNNLATVNKELGERDIAISYYLKALDIVKTNGTHPMEEAHINKNIATTLYEDEKFDEAADYIDRATQIFAASDDYLEYLQSLNIAFNIYFTGMDFSKSVETAENGLNIAEQKLGKINNSTAGFSYKTGMAYMALGNYPKALTMFLKACDIFRELKKEDTPTAILCHNLSNELSSLNKQHLYLCSIVKNGQADKRGLKGNYYVLRFNEWDCLSNDSLNAYSTSVSAAVPKTFILMSADGSIIKEEFKTGKVGLTYYQFQLVPEEQFSKTIKAFKEFLSKNSPDAQK